MEAQRNASPPVHGEWRPASRSFGVEPPRLASPLGLGYAWATNPSRTRANACKCLHIARGRKVRWEGKGLWVCVQLGRNSRKCCLAIC
jgi:hypothetical protein